ncbi:hypothetical protein G9A89_003848 [Geosiphon pyriformis]|nr:hypothetical protein G9A89_003848 [Geosiphon pyriformis]
MWRKKKRGRRRREWTPDSTQEWKKRLPPIYWFYKIGEQLDLENSYGDYNQKTFNKEAIQQVEEFIERSNLILHYKTACQLYTAFQYCPNVLLDGSLKKITFKDLQKAIVNITIKHYTNEVLSTDITDFIGAQY